MRIGDGVKRRLAHNALICRLIAPWLKLSSLAADEKLDVLAAAAKAASLRVEGRRRRWLMIISINHE